MRYLLQPGRIYSINFHVDRALFEVLAPLQSSEGASEAATRPRPLCKVCSARWDTLEAVPKTSLRMDFREKGGSAPRPCYCQKGFQLLLPRAHTSGGSNPKLQEPFSLPGATLPFFGLIHPKFQGWDFGGMKLQTFPAVFQRHWEAVAAQKERPASDIWV